MKFKDMIMINLKKWIGCTINHKDIGIGIGILYVLEMLNKVFKSIINVWIANFQYINKYIEKYWNILIIATWLILYILGWLTIRRLIIYTIIGIVIYGYKKIYEYTLTDKFKEKIMNIKKKEKLLYYLIKINNISLLMLIVNTEVKIYKLIEWYQTYNYKIFKFNWIVLLMSMIVPLKLMLSYKYTIFKNIQKYTMIEILWKRAFGLILSILIFTNIIQVIFMIFNTWLNIIIGIYVYIMLNALKDLQKTTQAELTYFNHSVNTFELRSKRNNILLGIIKILWNEIDKVKFYEKYNKKLNIIMYDALDIENYKRIKFIYQLNYLNDIKGEEEAKNVKVEFFKKLESSIFVPLLGMFDELNEISFLKLFFEFLEKEQKEGNYKKLQIKKKHKIQIQYLSKYTYIQVQLVLYFLWEYYKLNKEVIEEELYKMIIIKDEYEEELGFKVQHEFLDVKAKYEYKKFKYLGDEKIYEAVYEITQCLLIVEGEKGKIFEKAYKNELYKNFYEFDYNLFELEDGGAIPNDTIRYNIDIEGLEERYVEELKEIKKNLIKEYKEKDLYKILEEYEGVGNH